MKNLRFVASEMAGIIRRIETDPFVGDKAPKWETKVDSVLSVGIYPSRTQAKKEYRCTVLYDIKEGPQGQCSCRGWSQSKRAEGPSKPCIHIVDNLIRQDWFKIEEQLDVDELTLAKGKVERAEKKKAKEIPIVEPEVKVKRKKGSDAVAVIAEDEMHFGASSTPLLVACPASYVSPSEATTIVRSFGQPASLGTVVHTAAELIVGDRLTEPPDMSKQLEDAGVIDPQLLADVPGLLWAVINEWNGGNYDDREPLKSYFSTVDLEQRFSIEMHPKNPRTDERKKITVTAILDFNGQSNIEGHWIIGDWKSNRKEDEPYYAEQMRMNAAALMMNDKTVNKVTVILVWLRHGSRTVRTYSREQIRDWMKVLVKRTLFWDGRTYVTGDHCLYCDRTFTCEGRKTQLRNYVDIMGNIDTDMLLHDEAGVVLVPDELQRRLTVCKAFRKIDKGYVDALKVLLSEGGSQPLADQPGFELALKEKRGALKIDAAAAWPTLMEYATAEDISSALSISKTKLEAAVKGATKECEGCSGQGFNLVQVEGTEMSEQQQCEACDGTGEVEVYGRGKKGAAVKELMGKLEDREVAKRGKSSHEVVVQKIKGAS